MSTEFRGELPGRLSAAAGILLLNTLNQGELERGLTKGEERVVRIIAVYKKENSFVILRGPRRCSKKVGVKER